MILVSRLPFAWAVTSVVVVSPVTGLKNVLVTVKLKVASNMPLSVDLPESAVPRTVPENTRPCENITNAPAAIPVFGTPIENTPRLFAPHASRCLRRLQNSGVGAYHRRRARIYGPATKGEAFGRTEDDTHECRKENPRAAD